MYPVKRFFVSLRAFGLAAALALLLVVVSGSDTAHAIPFTPEATIKVTDSTPGKAADIISTFGVKTGDSNFGAVVSFTPPDWTVAKDADVPNGAIVAFLRAHVKLGLFGNQCNTSLTVEFNLMDASTDISDTISPKVDPPAGESTLDPLIEDNNPKNGLPDGVDYYPAFLNETLENHQPRARLFGTAEVPTTDIAVILNFVMFDPGALADLTELEGGLASGGYASVTVLNDPEAPLDIDSLNTITDFCSPLATETTTFGTSKDNLCTPPPGPPECRTPQGDHLIGVPGSGTNPDEGGAAVRANPDTPGKRVFSVFAASLRDADDDNIENPFDPCPLSPDDGRDAAHPLWDPRGPYVVQDPGDKDADGLPDSCDPKSTLSECTEQDLKENPNCPQSPVVTAGFDEDKDGFMNRADNCPLIANGIYEDYQDDKDDDGLGAACDPDDNDETNGGTQPRLEECVHGEQSTVKIGDSDEVIAISPCGQEDIAVDGNGAGDGAGDGDSDGAADGAGDDTAVAGETTGGTDAAGGAATGVGSLAPAVSSIPAWATIISALGGAGLLGSLGALASRLLRRRR